MNQNVSDVQKHAAISPMPERKNRPRRPSSTDLIDDRATPTLMSLIICESLRWGAIAIFLFVLYRFVEPKVTSFYNVVLAPQDEQNQQTDNRSENVNYND